MNAQTEPTWPRISTKCSIYNAATPPHRPLVPPNHENTQPAVLPMPPSCPPRLIRSRSPCCQGRPLLRQACSRSLAICRPCNPGLQRHRRRRRLFPLWRHLRFSQPLTRSLRRCVGAGVPCVVDKCVSCVFGVCLCLFVCFASRPCVWHFANVVGASLFVSFCLRHSVCTVHGVSGLCVFDSSV